MRGQKIMPNKGKMSQPFLFEKHLQRPFKDQGSNKSPSRMYQQSYYSRQAEPVKKPLECNKQTFYPNLKVEVNCRVAMDIEQPQSFSQIAYNEQAKNHKENYERQCYDRNTRQKAVPDQKEMLFGRSSYAEQKTLCEKQQYAAIVTENQFFERTLVESNKMFGKACKYGKKAKEFRKKSQVNLVNNVMFDQICRAPLKNANTFFLQKHDKNPTLSNFISKNERMVSQKVSYDTSLQKMAIEGPKRGQVVRAQAYMNQKKASFRRDDFTCYQELQLKPVQKKSLIPQRPSEIITTSKFDWTRNKREQKKADEREIKQFQERVEQAQNLKAQEQIMATMAAKQEQYRVGWNYIESNNGSKWSWWDRALLVDWLRQATYELTFHRQTYHVTVVLLDKYLSTTPSVVRKELQLIAISCLFIASKIEQFQPLNCEQCVQALLKQCTAKDIAEYEMKISWALEFKLNPPTMFCMANSILLHWDRFMNNSASDEYRMGLNNEVKFKISNDNNKAYGHFSSIMQLLDCTVMDIQTAQYSPKALILSFMYLYIGRELGSFDTKTIVSVFPLCSTYLNEWDQNQMNLLFEQFVSYCYGMVLIDLLPTIQYAATYFGLKIAMIAPALKEKQLQKMSFEAFCAIQTYNQAAKLCIQTRQRGFYKN